MFSVTLFLYKPTVPVPAGWTRLQPDSTSELPAGEDGKRGRVRLLSDAAFPHMPVIKRDYPYRGVSADFRMQNAGSMSLYHGYSPVPVDGLRRTDAV
jgi:hypothetical protein